MNLQKLCNQVLDLTRETGKFLLDEVNKVQSADIEEKGLHNFVSYADKTSEKRIVDSLTRILPEAGFIAEEGTSSHLGKKYNWIIDPLDGTTNYIHRIPVFSISIALNEQDKTVLGVVYDPTLNESFYAWENSPAYMNGIEIKVSKVTEFRNTLLATGFPYYDYGMMAEYMDLFTYFAENTSGLRRLGSAALDLAWTACGRVEGFYEYGLQPWDVAAGALIVQQAGGKVTDFKGGNNYIFGNKLLASNTLLHDKLLDAIQQHFKQKI
jgi:myo-inositol-1(or 4)-monophosphatase